MTRRIKSGGKVTPTETLMRFNIIISVPKKTIDHQKKTSLEKERQESKRQKGSIDDMAR